MFVQMKSMVGGYRKQHRETFDKNNLRYSRIFRQILYEKKNYSCH